MTNEPWASTPVLRVVGGSDVKKAVAEAASASDTVDAAERGLEHAKKVESACAMGCAR